MHLDMTRNFKNGLTVNGKPQPLEKTSIMVRVDGPVAGVEVSRIFRNSEECPIEALLTFPVPPSAAVYGMDILIDGRLLKGVVKAREKARAVYEKGMNRGKAAFL
jgi:hypothetical protein